MVADRHAVPIPASRNRTSPNDIRLRHSALQRLTISEVIGESGHSLAHIRDTALNEKPRSMPGLSRFRFDV
jgi:hypothetical protein